jgi:UDP-N-acetylmuramoyl-tripeptide--D-alanyl-D-alanine ligase
MITLTLSEIVAAVDGTVFGDGETVIRGISTDSRKIAKEELFVALRGERFDGHDFIDSLQGKCAAILTEEKHEGFSGILVSDTLKALGAMAAYWKSKVAPKITVGVTGSLGKTTTKELIASVLKEKYHTHFTGGNLNNHIGVPITLIRIERGCEALVCEMGMSAKGEIRYLTDLVRPNLAVITNIGTSHMEHLGSREGILEAKLEILAGMEKGGTVILDGDEPLLRSETVKASLKDFHVVYVGLHTGNDIYPLDIYKGADGLSFDVITKEGEFRLKIPAIGDHFVKNSLFAVAVGLLCGVEINRIQSGIASYSPAGLRQKIYETKGIRVIADCYNAAPESMQAALKVLSQWEGRRIAVLGDMLELGCLTETAHRKVGKIAYEYGADLLFLQGNSSIYTEEGAVEAGFQREKVFHFQDSEALAASLKEQLLPGDTVLFKASRNMKFEEIIALCGLTELKQ